jgi:corrinoid protein of di/trimethylamine methyltransferase
LASKEELLQSLSDCVVEMEDERVEDIAKEYLNAGYPAIDGITRGLVDGMNRTAILYEKEEYFVPELLICSDAMYNGLAVLRPHLDQAEESRKQKVVIGVVEGDTHDIGKNLVKIMLESAGYELIDLGKDVPLIKFIDTVKESGAQVVAMSTLMSTSMNNMKKVIEMLEQEGLRQKVKIIVGGGPISPAFAEKIGADGYSVNAIEAVKLVDQLTKGAA